MDPLPIALLIGKILMIIALAVAAWRLFAGPSIADRVVALDLIAGIVFGFVILIAIESREPLFLNVAFAIAIVTFLGTVAIARLLQREAKA
jgi:multicomponent Na+:H+ antiporter subunit F